MYLSGFWDYNFLYLIFILEVWVVFFSFLFLYDIDDFVLFDSIIDGIVFDSSYFEILN